MPRGPDGTFSLVPGTLVSTGDTIEVSQHNPPFLDVAQALTNSLDRDGTGGMRSNLNAGGFNVTNMAAGSAAGDAVNKAQLDAALSTATVPLGGVIDFWGDTAPSGFLMCFGQEISRTTYAALFAVIGTAAGAGNGTTTFNLPDYRGRVGAGKDNMGGVSADRLTTPVDGDILGASGGSQSHTLSVGEMPSHSHGVTDPSHLHDFTQFVLTGGSAVNNGSGLTETGVRQTAAALTGISIQANGGSGAHNNVQPIIVANKIMRVL